MPIVLPIIIAFQAIIIMFLLLRRPRRRDSQNPVSNNTWLVEENQRLQDHLDQCKEAGCYVEYEPQLCGTLLARAEEKAEEESTRTGFHDVYDSLYGAGSAEQFLAEAENSPFALKETPDANTALYEWLEERKKHKQEE